MNHEFITNLLSRTAAADPRLLSDWSSLFIWFTLHNDCSRTDMVELVDYLDIIIRQALPGADDVGYSVQTIPHPPAPL